MQQFVCSDQKSIVLIRAVSALLLTELLDALLDEFVDEFLDNLLGGLPGGAHDKYSHLGGCVYHQ
jgi:hypothetical protein